MKQVMKNEKGITLVAIVVTIIVLMILAGITLGLVLGQNGIITKAQYAKIQSEIGSEKEQLSMAVTEATLDNNGKQPTLEQIKDKIVEKGITTAENIKVGDDRLQVTTPKGHTYTIDQSGNVEYIGEGAVTVPNLTDANVAFTYTPSDWTNENVQVAITTTVKGFALQYSNDGNTWNDYTSAITASSNETIYARLWDGINYGGVATGNVTNIDKTNPTLTISTANTTNSITITATAADNESGIAGYKYSKDNGSTWQSSTSNTYTYTGLTQGQANQIVVQAYDKAGNTASKSATVTTGSVAGLTSANTTFTYTPSGWTNGNVQVGITTTETGYTLQYSTDGNTWNNYTGAIAITNNQAIYARLYDGTNYGGAVTGNVTNIDRTNPTLTLSQDTGSRTITINATDTQSGINAIQYNNSGTWQSLATSNITNGASATYAVTGNGTYTFRAIDNAGNVVLQDITVTGIITWKYTNQVATGDGDYVPDTYGNGPGCSAYLNINQTTTEKFSYLTNTYTFDKPFVLSKGQTISMYFNVTGAGTDTESYWSVYINGLNYNQKIYDSSSNYGNTTESPIYTVPSDTTVNNIILIIASGLNHSNGGVWAYSYMNSKVTVNSSYGSFVLDNSGTSGK